MRIEEGSVKRARKHWISNSTLHSSNLRSGTGWDRTHISRFKRPVHCLVCHNSVRFQLTSLADSAWWEWNPRPAPYKDAALTTELHAVASRAGGNRTHTERIKSPSCCQLHHNPICWLGVCVSIVTLAACRHPFLSCQW